MIVSGWACPSCGQRDVDDAAFCRRCGEERLGPERPSPFTAWRRWRHSLLTLVRRPGELTVDWREGRRRGQVAPLSLFLAINVVFFLAQSVSGLVLMAIPLEAHLHDQPHAEWARALLERRLAGGHVDRDRLTERFDLQQPALAKASVIAMVPAMAAMCALLFRRRRWDTHWVFSLHFHAFALVFVSVFFALLGLVLRGYMAMHWTITARAFDDVVSAIQTLFLGGYLLRAVRRVYGATGAVAVGSAALLFGTLVGALYAHRFAVFAATLYLS